MECSQTIFREVNYMLNESQTDFLLLANYGQNMQADVLLTIETSEILHHSMNIRSIS